MCIHFLIVHVNAALMCQLGLTPNSIFSSWRWEASSPASKIMFELKIKALGGLILLATNQNLSTETHLSSCKRERRAGCIKRTAFTQFTQQLAGCERLHHFSNRCPTPCPQNQPCISTRTSRALPSSCSASSWGVAKHSRTTPQSSCFRMRAYRCRRFRATCLWTAHEPAGEEPETAVWRTTDTVSERKHPVPEEIRMLSRFIIYHLMGRCLPLYCETSFLYCPQFCNLRTMNSIHFGTWLSCFTHPGSFFSHCLLDVPWDGWLRTFTDYNPLLHVKLG